MKLWYPLSFLLLLLLPFACKKEVKDKAVVDNFTHTSDVGKIVNPEINEASGLAASIKNEGMLWTHNDSGGKPRIFLLDESANLVYSYYLHGLENRDWEDIATGPGPEQGQSYVYIAEMGDNEAVHEYKYIYRLKEPEFHQHIEGKDSIVYDFDTVTFQFPDGKRDAETLMIDPMSNDLYIISKREESVGVYLLPYPQSTEEVIIPQKIGTLPFTQAVAGDISSSANEVLVKNYDEVFYWKRKPNESFADLFRRKPINLPYDREPQGEAIAWKKDGQGFFTLSEVKDGVIPSLYLHLKD